MTPRAAHRQVARNVAYSFAGTAAVAGAQWLAIAILAREGSPEEVGVFALAYAVTAPLVLFFGLNLRVLLATDAAGSYRFRDLLALRLGGLAAAAVCLTGVAYVFRMAESALVLTWVLFAARVWDSFSDLGYGRLQRDERMGCIAASRVLRGAVQIAVFWATYRSTRDVLSATVGLAVASAVATLGFDVPALLMSQIDGRGVRTRARWTMRSLRSDWEGTRLRKLLVLVLPLATLAVLDSLNANIPRYFLERTHGASALGYFAGLAALFLLYGAVVSALADAVRARLARHAVSDHRRFVREALWLTGASAALGLLSLAIAYVAGGPILRFLYAPSYAQHAPALCWLMAGAALWGMSGCLATAIQAAQRFAPVAAIFVVMTVATVLGAVVLVPPFGVDGAVGAVCFGMAVRLVGLGWWWRRFLGELDTERCEHRPLAAATL